ncbi:hypothetical protein [Kitasatospora sp. NPDC098663]|uniref:hypothetical protein n=1 Tax=Kitasatospora sp. NPDC098663 TaxID=3364096 RepID=UPI00380A67A4
MPQPPPACEHFTRIPASPPHLEHPLATRSVIARPTGAGFTGIYCHLDGYPSHMLPLLLAAQQHRFDGDVEALSHHLIDTPALEWKELGSDLLDGAPRRIRTALVGYEPSKQSDPSRIITSDGSPPQKYLITEERTEELSWAYVLRPHGVEVIGLYEHERGPVVPWGTDPTSSFSDSAGLWSRDRRLPILPPPSPAASAARASSGSIRSAAPAGSAEPVDTHGLVDTPKPTAGRVR